MIVHLIKTKSILSDGRLLKTIDTLKELGFNSSVIALEDSNISVIEETSKYFLQTFSLFSRRIFSKGKGFILKVPEYTYKSVSLALKKTKKNDIIICHDNQNYLGIFFLSFLKKNRFIIWDQHELPHPVFFRFAPLKMFLQFLCKKVDYIIFTNEERRNIVCDSFNIDKNRTAIIHNYPQKEYISEDKRPLPKELNNWLNGSEYFLWLGIANNDRNFPSAFKAFTKFSDRFKLVIVGTLPEEQELQLKKMLGSRYKQLVYQKFVPQTTIMNYIDNAKISLVFYKNNSLNNYFCEPNRLYQLITREIPVVSGNNPRLSSIVRWHNTGVVLNSDGTDSDEITNAIKCVLDQHKIYSTNCKKSKNLYNWENEARLIYSSILKMAN